MQSVSSLGGGPVRTAAQQEAAIAKLLPLVRRIARDRKWSWEDFDDVFSDGCLGVVRAVRRYDPTVGTLAGYAHSCIVWAILNGRNRTRRRMPRSAQRVFARATQTLNELAQAEEAVPTENRLESLVEGYRAARQRAALFAAHPVPLGLPATITTQRCTSAPETPLTTDRIAPSPEDIVLDHLDGLALRTTVESLPPRERTVIVGLYFAGKSAVTLARDCGVTPQRVRQIHEDALRRLRTLVAPCDLNVCVAPEVCAVASR
jgi:RNA polymerase sigma factor (sigma-70 family)